MSAKRFQSLKAIRVAGYLLPPLGLILLWRSSLVGWGRKVFGSIFLLIFTLLYLCAATAFLYYVMGIDLIEWRGGYTPVLTLSKTLPNYAKLEEDRAKRAHEDAQAATLKGDVYWTAFRGPNRDGHYDGRPILTNWPKEGLRLEWRQPVGGGYSSFSVAGGRAFTIEQRRDYETVTAYAITDGRELWTNGWPDRFFEAIGGEGPRATPTYDDGRLYAMGGTGDLRCLEADSGKVIWRRNIIADARADVPTYGASVSPLIVNEEIIVLPGGTNGQSVAALNKLTGAPIWQSQSERQAYTSPMLVTLAGQQQLLVVSTRSVMGLAPEDGRLLWHQPWIVDNDNAIAQPVMLGPNRFLLSAGYGKGCTAYELSQTNGRFFAVALWHNSYLKNKFSSSVFFQGCIYGLDDETLTCLDAETGERKWREGHYGYGQLLLARDQLVILSASGELALVKASPSQYQELARFQAIQGKTWNQPAISDGKIFVRNSVEMACFAIGE
jgi:outer membrane protein assembly factor BamB